MKISIIGGAGFVGNRLSKRLGNANIDHTVFDVNNLKESHQYVDVTNIESLNSIKNSDIIINLAAVHRDDIRPISIYDDINVTGAQNICNVAEKYDIKKIIINNIALSVGRLGTG